MLELFKAKDAEGNPNQERHKTMSIGLLFWVIMIIGLLFGFYSNRTTPMVWVSNSLILWILLALLGWQVFGPAIHR